MPISQWYKTDNNHQGLKPKPKRTLTIDNMHNITINGKQHKR
jgi:hypothetical protein